PALDELAPRQPFAVLPIRETEILVEYDYGAWNDPAPEQRQDELCRFKSNSVEVNEGKGPGVIGQEPRHGFVEPSLDQPDVGQHIGRLSAEIEMARPVRRASPVFLQSLETVEAVDRDVLGLHGPGNMIDRPAHVHAKLGEQSTDPDARERVVPNLFPG